VDFEVAPRSLPDIKPQSPVATLDRAAFAGVTHRFPMSAVAPAVGMSPVFIRKVVGKADTLSADDVLILLDQDAYGETFVRRSQVLDYLLSLEATDPPAADHEDTFDEPDDWALHHGSVLDLVKRLPAAGVNNITTSTPYWGMRIYKDSHFVQWADGEDCPLGHEQTPEGFARHTAQLLHALAPVLAEDGSIWWNLMDSYNTRTQIRGNAAEALRAMQGHDRRAWAEHEARRYSAGHDHLLDGEQCLVPGLVAERASRLGLYVKSTITWAKPYTLPEPQNSRVSRSLEYVLHLSKIRTPKFHREAYRQLAMSLGGRNPLLETDKLSDVWAISTSSGGNGHGAQFPTALPGRCIGLTTDGTKLCSTPSQAVATQALPHCRSDVGSSGST
jgi:DNA modification methylase